MYLACRLTLGENLSCLGRIWSVCFSLLCGQHLAAPQVLVE